MSNNPYYTGDEDDDIFGTSSSEQNNNPEIPSYLEDALQKYIAETRSAESIPDFFASVANHISIESFSLEALHAVLDSGLFLWLEEKETIMFPFNSINQNDSQNAEIVRSLFIEGLVEKGFALVQLNWLVFLKIDYMANAILDYMDNESLEKNNEYKNYNINYLKIVNTFIKNMLEIYTVKFYNFLQDIFENKEFQKYAPVYNNMCALQEIMDKEVSPLSQEEKISYYNEFASIINDSFDIVQQIKDESIAATV